MPAPIRGAAIAALLVVSVSAQEASRRPQDAAANWPSFRGAQASGVSPSAQPPITWNVGSSSNVVWRVSIPGLAHSSPIVWGDRVYLTTAIGPGAAAQALTLGDSDRAGIDPAKDAVPHQWQLIALDRGSGKVVWTRTAHQGVPRIKRHVKASHASATPATNGRVIVAMFGSEGLFAFDASGAELWRKDLGLLAVGLADEPEYEWGPGSSPVIDGDRVIVQNDRYKDSYLAAFDLQTGKEIWRVRREERPSWTTPLVHTSAGASMIVAVSPFFVRGHDAATGREQWRLSDPDGQVKVSTPIAAGDLAIVTGGWPPAARPITAVRVRDGAVVWSHERGSPYTTTPIVYQELVYVLTDNGILSAYRVADGTRVYQTRLSPTAGSFSASPVAAAGRLYFTSEDGQVFVVRAGPEFRLLATNEMNDVCMATPALSGDLLILRTKSTMYALGNRPAS
jgi:outer membrane protein assembly factor BamB